MDWEHGRRAVGISAAHWEPEGLTDYNPRSATRSVVPGNRRIIIPRSIVKRKRACFGSFSGKMDRSAQTDNTAVLQRGAQHCRLHVLALFPMSLVWAGTYLPCWYAVVKLQMNCKIFAVHLVAQEKGQNITHLKNIFSVFFGADKCAY